MDSTRTDVGPLASRSRLSAFAVSMLTGGQGRPAAIVVAVLLTLFQVGWGEPYWRPIRNAVFDAYQRAFPRQIERLPVVIVDIDDASLAALGQWPWPRTRLARLIEATHQLGALAVALDMIMPEADRLSPDVFLADRADVSPALQVELARLPSNDTILAEVLRRTPAILGRAGTSERGSPGTPYKSQTPVRLYGETPLAHVQAYAEHVGNIPQLEAAASGRGYLNATPDADGVVRTLPLLVAIHGEMAPTLALELFRMMSGAAWYSVYTSPGGLQGVQVGASFMPTDPDGRRHLYFSPPDARRRVAALDVLNGNLAAHAFHQQVAIIGVTGLGLADVVPTPVANLMDGVEVQAQFVENLLSGVRLVRPWPIPWLELLAFLSGAAALIVLLPRVRPVTSVAVFLGLAAVLSAIGLVTFTRAHVLSDPSFPVAGHAVVLVVFLTAGFAASDRTRRELRFVREIFGRYLTDEVVASLLDSPGGLVLGGEQRPVTILMSDLRGFTSLAGRLAPAQVVTMLNRYLSTMVEVIAHYQGTINEFIGDGIFVIFGAPIRREDDTLRAVTCAVAMQLAMTTVNAEHRRAGLPEVEMGIGVHTGEVVVGNIGSHRRAKYGVVGSHVNLTSRIQSYTIGGQILISEATRQAVEPLVKLSRQMEVEAKGIAEPITLYELRGIGGAYNLFLPEREEALVALGQALPLQYTVLEGEHIKQTVYTGSFVRLSARGGEVYSDYPIAPWSNIRVHLIGHNGEAHPEELYAKVLRHLPDGRAGFYVSFTSVSPAAAVLFQRLLASGSPSER